MGQRWSRLKFGHLESESEEEDSVSLSLQQIQATTEASSSLPVFDRGLCTTCPNDIEIDDAMVVTFLERLLKFNFIINNNLSNLNSGGNLHSRGVTVTRRKRGNEACMTPTPSTSHFSSVHGSLKDSEIKASPSVATCRVRSQVKVLDHKLEAYREALHGQFALRKLGASGVMVQSPSLTSLAPSQSSDPVANLLELARNNDKVEMLNSPVSRLTTKLDFVKVVGVTKLEAVMSQPPVHSPAQTLLLFQLGRKRKSSSGLPRLAFDCTGYPTHVQLKARTPLERPSEGVSRAAVLDLGTGDAMVGRCVRKEVEGRGFCKGCVSCYNAAQRVYQIKYDDGVEEVLEWLDLEPYLVANPAQARPRYKTVDELLYTKRKRPGRRVGKKMTLPVSEYC